MGAEIVGLVDVALKIGLELAEVVPQRREIRPISTAKRRGVGRRQLRGPDQVFNKWM